MATLYKHGEVLADYTRFVAQRDGTKLGYIFRHMSDGWILVRPHRTGGRWRMFNKGKILLDIQCTIDTFLRAQLDNCFN
jgi:hypothetical protein